jgi:hypothetical protein
MDANKATRWMQIKGIGSDAEFGQFLVNLMDRAKMPASDTNEEADRLVAEGQLQLHMARASEKFGRSETQRKLHNVSHILVHLFDEPSGLEKATSKPFAPTPRPSTSTPTVTPQLPARVPVQNEPPTRPVVVTAKSKAVKPVADEDPDQAARSKYGFLLSHARAFIKSKQYSVAKQRLQRIIDEAPGTKLAAEAKELLDTIPQ